MTIKKKMTITGGCLCTGERKSSNLNAGEIANRKLIILVFILHLFNNLH